MKMNPVESVQLGDTLEQNIYRHDSLLALPKGTRILEKEKEYLKDLQLQYIYSNVFDPSRIYDDKETLNILKDAFKSCTLWEDKLGLKIFEAIKSRLKKHKKILNLFTLLRKADHYSFVSSVNISIIVAKTMMLNGKVDKHLIDLVFYTLIHDIGKIRVSRITTKEGELTDLEFQEVRKHPIYSHQLLLKFGFPKKNILFAFQTHERYDGSGYPLRIMGEDIQPLAQVIALAEMYNALSSFRPHRPAFHPIEVRNKIKEEEDRAFAKKYIDTFLEKFIPYREGVKIELSNGLEGKIVEVNDRVPLFPTVEIYDPNTGEVYSTVNLFRKKELRIARILL